VNFWIWYQCVASGWIPGCFFHWFDGAGRLKRVFSRYEPQGDGDRGEPAVLGCGIDIVQAHEVGGGARGAY